MKRGKNQKRKAVINIVLFIICFLFGVFILLLLGYKLLRAQPEISNSQTSVTSTSSEQEIVDTSPIIPTTNSKFDRKEKCYTFLVVASDQSSGNADTIMVITFDTINSKVGIVSIPRDTLINPEDGYSSYPKINSTYLRGIDNLTGAVSNLLGIPIDFYVTVSVEGFVAIIDAIDGIDFDIPVHMSYDDPLQNLHIHFEPGLAHLDGKDALKVCRLRDNNDGTLAYPDYDIGRTRTQQKLLIAVGKKVLLHPQKISEYLKIFNQYVDTNLSFRNALWFIEPALSVDFEKDVSVSTLPGDGTVSYKKARYCYELYPEETVSIVNDLISPYTTPISLEDMNLFSVK